jgi:signal transduction histidine kinase/CheY-like chemotaxis protein
VPSTILVVDDDYHVLRAMCAILEPLGDILGAESAAVALEYIGSGSIDLLVADLRLPDASGIDLIARARALIPQLPAILLTSQAETSDLVAAINRAEVYRFLEKPLDNDDLLQTAKTALEAVGLRRERERLHRELERSHSAMRVLYEATRDLAHASGRAEIVHSTLANLARIVPFELGAVLVAPPPAQNAVLYLHASSQFDEEALDIFRDRALGRFMSRSGTTIADHRTKLTLLGRGAPIRIADAEAAEIIDAPLEVGGQVLGIIQLMRSNAPFGSEAARLLDVLGSQIAQALRRDEELQQSQRRQLEMLLSSMPDGVLMTGEDRQVTVVNPAARRMLGFTESEAITAESLRERLGFDPFEVVRGWGRSGSEAFRAEVALAGRTLHTIVSPVVDMSGVTAGFGILLRDFTSEKHLENQKEEFVTVVSHELRTPLASIAGSLDLVLRGYTGDVSTKQKHYLDMARDSCTKLHRIVDDLLDITKHESGHLEVAFEEVDLSTVLAEVSEKFQPAALQQRVALSAEAPEAAPIAGDVGRLTQVLVNLLSNAAKFTPEGGRIEVSLLSAAAPTDHVGFQVWNSGTSIDEVDLERIFEKFSQLLLGKQKTGGTGLGLAIARGLVEIQGGRLWAERTWPDGVGFLGVFPRLEGPPLQPTLDGIALSAIGSTTSGKSGRAVLIGDRDPTTAALLKGVCLRYGLPAITAVSVDRVLSVARNRSLALIALDPELGGDGALLQVLAHDPDTREVPVLLTAPSKNPVAPPFRELQRPFSGADFIDALAQAAMVHEAATRARVLIVDGDEAERLIFAEVLSGEGHEVLAFANAAEALAHARERAPNACIIDAHLDGASELAHALHDMSGDGPALLVLGDAGSSRPFPPAEHLTKPLEAQTLAERTRHCVERRTVPSLPPRLPGPPSLERQIDEICGAAGPFGYVEITILHLDVYDEIYGRMKAEGILHQLADLLEAILARYPLSSAGQASANAFAVVTTPEDAEAIAASLLGSLENVLPLYYHSADRERGFVHVPSEDGERRAPLMRARIVVVCDHGARFRSRAELLAAVRECRERGEDGGDTPAEARETV